MLLTAEVRSCLVKALFLLKGKGLIDSCTLLTALIPLWKCQDKVGRESLYASILSDIKAANRKTKNPQLNRSLQTIIYGALEKSGHIIGRYALRLLIDLYKTGLWRDSRSVNVIAGCCFERENKNAIVAMKFFVLTESSSGADEDSSSSEDEEDSAPKRHGKNSKPVIQKKKKKQPIAPSFHALEMLNDPQSFAERLYQRAKSAAERFKIKLLIMNVLSCTIAVHKLSIPDVYQFYTRYLTPHQRDVTQILSYAAQSCHPGVGGDEIEGMLRAVANNFVADHCANEVIVVGLNSIREMARRCPEAMSEALLQDLAQYKKFKDKGVMMASRSLIGLFRELNPQLLHRRDRGKPTKAGQENEEEIDEDEEEIEEADIDEDAEEIDAEEIEDEEWESGDELEESDQESDQQESDQEIESPSQDLNSKVPTPLPSASSDDDEQDTNIHNLVSCSTIENPHRKRKATYSERLACIQEGRKDRPEFKSRKSKRKAVPTSNKTKSKKKNFLMMVHKQSVRAKSTRSLQTKQQVKNAHAKRQKRK